MCVISVETEILIDIWLYIILLCKLLCSWCKNRLDWCHCLDRSWRHWWCCYYCSCCSLIHIFQV